MSPIALTLNLLLATLLMLALGVGWRLNRRLKALRDSHAGFAVAVGELDRAARRAEVGLTALRAATDEALELLVGRVEKARELAVKLEQLTEQAQTAADRVRTPSPLSALERKWPKAADEREPARPVGRAAPPRAEPDADAEAAAEAVAEHLVLRLSRDDVAHAKSPPRIDGRVEGRLDARLAARAELRAAPRSRTLIDDDLFDAPAGRAGSGGRS
jgi:hypothetical protein